MSLIGQKRNVRSWDECLPIPNLSRKVSVVLVTVLSVVCYVASVDGDFVFDDTEAVVNNKDIKLETPIHQLFYNDFWGTSMTHNQSHKSYRPLTILSFRLNLWFNNGVLSSYQFRLCNLLLHCVVCVLSINVFELLMGGNCQKAANLCAILFSIHPIHTEAVAGVVGRAELLCALFSFISFILYNKAIYTTGYLGSFYYTLVSIFFASLSMFSKEQGITVLGINFVYEVWMVNNKKIKLYSNEFYRSVRIFIKNLVNNNNNNNNNGAVNKISVNNCENNNQTCTNFISLFITRFVLLFISGSVLLYVRWKVMDGTPPIFQKVDNLAAFADSFIVRVINYNYIYTVNAWILLCPTWLCFDWSMGCIPLITDVNDPRMITVIIFWVVVLLLILQCLKRNNEYSKTDRSIIMGWMFIVISFLPASNVFFKVGFVIAERVLYLPSVGYCIIIINSVHRFFNFLTNVSHQKSMYINVASVIFWLYVITTYSARSIQRSNDWRTESKLFQSALSVCPLNAKVHYNLGKVAINKTLSIEYYKHAIRLNPEYDQAMNNLANILKDDGSLLEAEELLRKSIQLRPNFAAAWMNLGIVLSNKKQYSEAEFSYLEAIKFRKNYPDCYYNLGNLYLDQNHYAEANSSWRKAISQKPSHSIAWNNLIIMLDSIGKYEEAKSTALEALFVLPTDAGIHFNLANTLGKLSQFDEAEKHFKIAIELNSNQALYYVNLGVLYHRWKKFKNAKDMYLKALKINPKLESAERNLKMLPDFK